MSYSKCDEIKKALSFPWKTPFFYGLHESYGILPLLCLWGGIAPSNTSPTDHILSSMLIKF